MLKGKNTIFGKVKLGYVYEPNRLVTKEEIVRECLMCYIYCGGEVCTLYSHRK